MKLLTLSLVWVVPWCLRGSLSELNVWMTAERSLSEEGTCKCTYMLTLNTSLWCLATLYVLLAVHFWLDLAICCDRQSDRETDLQTNMLTVGQPIELTDQRPDMFTDRQTNKQTKQTNDPTKQLYFQSQNGHSVKYSCMGFFKPLICSQSSGLRERSPSGAGIAP